MYEYNYIEESQRCEVLSMRKEDRVLFMREEDRQSRILSLDEQSFDRVTSQVHNFRAAHTDSWLIFGSSSQHFAHVFLTDAFLIILDCVKVLSLYPSVLLTFVSISDDVVTLPAAFDLISGLPNRRYLLFPAHDLWFYLIPSFTSLLFDCQGSKLLGVEGSFPQRKPKLIDLFFNGQADIGSDGCIFKIRWLLERLSF